MATRLGKAKCDIFVNPNKKNNLYYYISCD